MSQSLQGARVMVVDDEEANLRVLDRILRQSGCGEVVLSTTGADAIARFVGCRPDVVLLDLHLPDGSGTDVLERLRTLTPADDFVPIVMLTGDTSQQARQAALSKGANDFINKPFEITEVLLRIRNLLQMRQLHARVREENVTLDARVRERTKELEDARVETLERLARAGEFRDDNTGQHAKRVGELSGLLAQACGIDRGVCEVIRRAAPLHDIGKIGIPDSILLKPGSLTSEEFAVMMTHTTIGAQILSGSHSDVLRSAEVIALSHHERWDGSGYPAGLRAEMIPMAARIVSVVDFYDALSSDRPYRAAWPILKIRTEIQRQRGLQFDPAVADSFLDLSAALT